MILRELREAKGLTQQELADATGIDRASIVKYEGGSRQPPYDKIKILADFFHVPIETLMGEGERAVLDAEAWEYREEVKQNPDLRALFSTAKGVKREDLQKTIQILKAFKGDSPLNR